MDMFLSDKRVNRLCWAILPVGKEFILTWMRDSFCGEVFQAYYQQDAEAILGEDRLALFEVKIVPAAPRRKEPLSLVKSNEVF